MQVSKILFTITVFLFSLGQLVAVSKQEFSNLYLFDISLFVFVIYGFYFFLIKVKKFYLPSVALLFIAFSFIALLSLIRVFYLYNNQELLISFLYFIRWILYLSSGILVYNYIYQNEFNLKFITNTFILSGLLITTFGFLQLMILPDLEILSKSYGWDPHKNRMFGTFLDPNFLGAYLNIIIVLLLDKHYSKSKLNLLGIFTLGVLIFGLFLTFSRSAWLMFSIIILIYGLYRSKLLFTTFLIIAFSAYFAVPRIQTRLAGITDPNDSAYFRIISWKNTLEIAKDNLFLGVGFNTFRFAQRDYGLIDYKNFESHGASGSDSSILFILATTGIIGLIFFISGFTFVLIQTKSLIIKSIILGLLVESFFINSLFYPQILFVWLIFIINYSIFDK